MIKTSIDFLKNKMRADSNLLPTARRPSIINILPLLCFFLVCSIFVCSNSKLLAKDYVRLRLCSGFDHPVGKPDAVGYYRARGANFNSRRRAIHVGDDWNGNGGGNTDIGHPVYSIGYGIVLFATNIHHGFGKSVLIRHAYRERDGKVNFVDSFYTHLHKIHTKRGKKVKRGEKIGTIGTGGGLYMAHLHFEIRRNLKIGYRRWEFPKTNSNFHYPTEFINTRRRLPISFRRIKTPINTFPLPKEK